MVHVDLYYNEDILYRLKISGHAGYDEHGSDIVCSAISILVINTINAIELYSKEEFLYNKIQKKKGIIDCSFPKRKQGNIDESATLLLNTMVLGLETIEQMYGEYIEIKNKN